MDIENVPKLFIDAFCVKQIEKDEKDKPKPQYGHLGLYQDDTLDDVKALEIVGERTKEDDTTQVQILWRAKRQDEL